jgi:hypothetical protein
MRKRITLRLPCVILLSAQFLFSRLLLRVEKERKEEKKEKKREEGNNPSLPPSLQASPNHATNAPRFQSIKSKHRPRNTVFTRFIGLVAKKWRRRDPI